MLYLITTNMITIPSSISIIYVNFGTSASSWADVPNWPLMSTNNGDGLVNRNGDDGKDKNANRR